MLRSCEIQEATSDSVGAAGATDRSAARGGGEGTPELTATTAGDSESGTRCRLINRNPHQESVQKKTVILSWCPPLGQVE